jgi:DNA-directed RNA polymerase specialized sigma24 family protein
MNEQDYKLIQSEVRYQRQLSEEDREDLVQDVCVKLLEGKQEHITRAFLRTLIRNMLIDKGRKEVRRPQITSNDTDIALESPIDELAGAMRGDKDVRPRTKRAQKRRRG